MTFIASQHIINYSYIYIILIAMRVDIFLLERLLYYLPKDVHCLHDSSLLIPEVTYFIEIDLNTPRDRLVMTISPSFQF